MLEVGVLLKLLLKGFLCWCRFVLVELYFNVVEDFW